MNIVHSLSAIGCCPVEISFGVSPCIYGDVAGRRMEKSSSASVLDHRQIALGAVTNTLYKVHSSTFEIAITNKRSGAIWAVSGAGFFCRLLLPASAAGLCCTLPLWPPNRCGERSWLNNLTGIRVQVHNVCYTQSASQISCNLDCSNVRITASVVQTVPKQTVP